VGIDLAYEHDNYDFRRGWAETKPGWYLCSISLERQSTPPKELHEMLEWMHNNIDNCEAHARWCTSIMFGKFHVRFRYERDFIMFTLRWK